MNNEENSNLAIDQQLLNLSNRSQKEFIESRTIFNYPHQPIDKFPDSGNDLDDFGDSQLNIEQRDRNVSHVNHLLQINLDEKQIVQRNVQKMSQLSSKLCPFLHLLDQDIHLCTHPNYFFLPDAKIIQCIKFSFYLFYSILLFTLPLQVALNDSNNLQYYLIFIFIEIGCKLITGIIVDGEVVLNFRSILNQYKNTDLVVDLILLALLVQTMIISQFPIQIICLMGGSLLIQGKRVVYQNHLQLVFSIYDKQVIFLTHVFNYLIFLNLLGCLLLYSVQELDVFQSISLSDQYFNSIYSLIEFNSHLTPKCSTSAISIAVINVLYIFLNAYILIEFYQFRKINKSLTKLHQYFQEKQPNLSIKIKLLSEVDKINQLQIYKDQTEKLNEFTEKSSVLGGYFSYLCQKTINSFVTKASIEIYHQNQVIIQQDQAHDSSIYFVLEGQVAVLSKNGKELKKLKKSNHFGELSFYTNQRRTATVVCLSYCRLLKLSRSDFLQEATFLEKVENSLKNSKPFSKFLTRSSKKSKCLVNVSVVIPRNTVIEILKIDIHACPQLIYHPEPLQILQKSDSNSSMIITQEGNKQFKRYRQIKTRIPYNILKQIDVSMYEMMRIEYQRVSSSILSEIDLSYENDIYKFSLNSNIDKRSILPKKSESNRKIGIDLEFSLGSKDLQTIFERVEDEDSPVSERYHEFFSKSLECPQEDQHSVNSNILNDKIRSKSAREVNIKKIGQIDRIQSDFRVFFSIKKDLESQNVELQDFDVMESYEQYFPNNNYFNAIIKANKSNQQ